LKKVYYGLSSKFCSEKILPLVFSFCLSACLILDWGEDGCSFSKKNKENKEASKEQIENFNSSKN
tara:strand:+ start:217 stop:411 length:195 start_codon:yes stop_codon:yes gene_type:complete